MRFAEVLVEQEIPSILTLIGIDPYAPDPRTSAPAVSSRSPATTSAPSGFTRLETADGIIEVANDYMRSGNNYVTTSADQAASYAQSNGYIIPTEAMIQAIYSSARIIPMPTQAQWDPNSRFYPNGDAAYHTQQILELTGGSFPSGLVAGHKKEWKRNSDGSIGMVGGAKSGGGFWQGISSRGQAHQSGGRNTHSDYSQGYRIVRLVQ